MNTILHNNGVYNIFCSTINGAVFDSGLTLKQLTQHVENDYSQGGLLRLPERVERAQKFGTSSSIDSSLEVTISNNCAGDNGECLSLRAFIGRFLTLNKNGGGTDPTFTQAILRIHH